MAVVLFIADQLAKLWVLHGIDFSAGPVRVLPFLNITLIWNRGISYGLLQQEGLGRWLLVVATLAVSVGLGVWLMRARRLLLAVAIGTILGGAMGNLVDRVAYGAVVDYVHLHYAGFNWYVFNIADAAIVIGVALLLLDSVVGGRSGQTKD
nr:signal peptidase II [Acuticoccus mangrovi]